MRTIVGRYGVLLAAFWASKSDLTTRHCYEITLISFKDLDFMDDKSIVESNGTESSQALASRIVVDQFDANLSNSHMMAKFYFKNVVEFWNTESGVSHATEL